MKKVLVAAIALFSLSGTAQPYGTREYGTSAVLTQGGLTGINPGNNGFIMTGVTSGGNFMIQKTIQGGVVPSPGPTGFQNMYSISKTVGCLGTTGAITTCQGLSIMEIPVNSYGQQYVVSGAYEEGVFYNYLQADGTELSIYCHTFLFPSTATSFNKTIMTQDASGAIYICGQYNNDMYIIKVVGSTVIWSKFYSNDTYLSPRSIIMSANGSEVVVVGHCNTATTSSDGFFLTVNATSGGINVLKNYNYLPCTWFNSVKVANNPANGTGYIIGGHNDAPTGTTGEALMLKVDGSGTVIWSNIITGNFTNEEVVAVVERAPSLPGGDYEYYGLVTTLDVPTQLSSMSIYKLDKLGNPFSTSHPANDEFYYQAQPSTYFTPMSLDYISSGGSDVGLHAYADHSGSFYLLESYFNGVTGCGQQLMQLGQVMPGPSDISMGGSSSNFVSWCDHVTMAVSAQTFPTNMCSQPSVGGGSNARTMATTGITEQTQDLSTSIYPNPSRDKITVSFPAASGSAKVELVNALGQVIKTSTLSVENAGIYEQEFDLASLQVQPGIYFVNITSGGNRTSHKVVYMDKH